MQQIGSFELYRDAPIGLAVAVPGGLHLSYEITRPIPSFNRQHLHFFALIYAISIRPANRVRQATTQRQTLWRNHNH
jgi:hypothetical protein